MREGTEGGGCLRLAMAHVEGVDALMCSTRPAPRPCRSNPCPHAPPSLYCTVQISAFFPSHHMKAMAQNAEMRKLEGEVAALLAGAAQCLLARGLAWLCVVPRCPH